ncbi:amino acid permease [Flavobacterium sp. JRM]|nr:amino acid permease [Flavobacterium sp. JRM]
MKRKYILPLFLLLQIIILKIIPFFPEFIEKNYSNGLYLKIASFSRIVLGGIPFSIGDCIYFILIVLFLRWLWIKRKSWKLLWKDNLLTVLSYLSVFYFLFHFLWAFNYYREPLFEKMGIQKEYTDADLLAFTKKLIAKTNTIQLQITKNDSLKVVFPYSQEQVFNMNLNGYNNLAAEHPYFTYSHLSVKKSLFSLPLTYMGFGGYLNPFTNEAQVNSLGPMYSFPMTTNHEMAHQMGYASENECNFIGFLASIKNDNIYIQYSGYSLALRYCLGIIQAKDEKLSKQLVKTVHPGIIKNYKESQDFWKQYETFIETGFHIFYDNFLKINQQKDGMESYSKFVDLMVNYYKGKDL